MVELRVFVWQIISHLIILYIAKTNLCSFFWVAIGDLKNLNCCSILYIHFTPLVLSWRNLLGSRIVSTMWNQHVVVNICILGFKCRMTLLLGPPGSGKSSLLLALAGKLDKRLKVSTCCNSPFVIKYITCLTLANHWPFTSSF